MSSKKQQIGSNQAAWNGESNILVALRCRPLNEKESRTSRSTIRVLDEKVVVVQDPNADSEDILRANRARDRRYAFDHAFGPERDQEYVYNHTTRFLIDGVVNGYNATVFAYGATGAGKTYTMLGTARTPGLMILTLEDMYRRIEQLKAERFLEFTVSLTYVEIYNENIRDLLSPSDEHLDLREDPLKGPQVAGVTELEASTTEEVMRLLARGNKYRSQEPTGANKESSRSHAVLQIFVESKERNGEKVKVGKLSLIDLAGSERASSTNNRGLRLIEGANINRSLLALGNVINALGSNSKGTYIPYRDSKLTRMLKDSLGGNCRTVMIANISPAASHFEETINTLKYANRAKNIKTKVSKNVLSVNYHIAEYENLIKGLREEIFDLKTKLGANTPAPVAGSVSRTTQRSSEETEELKNLRDALIDNFKERMQLRRSLIELQAQNVHNNIQISRRQVEIARWEEANRKASMLQEVSPIDADLLSDTSSDEALSSAVLAGEPDVAAARRECEELTQAILANAEVKKDILERLAKKSDDSKQLRFALQQKTTPDELREVLTLEYRVVVLELEKLELENTSMLREQIVKQRDMELAKLRLQLKIRDRVIAAQLRVLRRHNLDSQVDHTVIEALDSVISSESAPVTSAMEATLGHGLHLRARMRSAAERSDKHCAAKLDTASDSDSFTGMFPPLTALAKTRGAAEKRRHGESEPFRNGPISHAIHAPNMNQKKQSAAKSKRRIGRNGVNEVKVHPIVSPSQLCRPSIHHTAETSTQLSDGSDGEASSLSDVPPPPQGLEASHSVPVLPMGRRNRLTPPASRHQHDNRTTDDISFSVKHAFAVGNSGQPKATLKSAEVLHPRRHSVDTIQTSHSPTCTQPETALAQASPHQQQRQRRAKRARKAHAKAVAIYGGRRITRRAIGKSNAHIAQARAVAAEVAKLQHKTSLERVADLPPQPAAVDSLPGYAGSSAQAYHQVSPSNGRSCAQKAPQRRTAAEVGNANDIKRLRVRGGRHGRYNRRKQQDGGCDQNIWKDPGRESLAINGHNPTSHAAVKNKDIRGHNPGVKVIAGGLSVGRIRSPSASSNRLLDKLLPASDIPALSSS